MASSEEVKAFLNMIIPIAQEQARKHNGKLFPSVCIAQACCESAYGTQPKMKRANAAFGIKVGKSAYKFGTAWKGAAYKTGTTEYYDGKNATKIVDFFRAYESLTDSTEDYMDMLCHCTRYHKALNCASPRDSIYQIKNGGYATAPDYVTTIMNIIRKYELVRYDPGNKEAHNPYDVPNVNIKIGAKGSAVRWLQWELNHDMGLTLVVDGIFGLNTDKALREYQKAHGLVVDGICGPITRGELLKRLD